MTHKVLDDGFGNQWLMCAHPKCDLQIVRPGKVQCKVQCSEYCDDLSMEELLSSQYFGGDHTDTTENIATHE